MAIILENFPGLIAMWRMVENEEDWIRDQRCIINTVRAAKKVPSEDWPVPIKAIENFLWVLFIASKKKFVADLVVSDIQNSGMLA